jgi:hypothetical protein
MVSVAPPMLSPVIPWYRGHLGSIAFKVRRANRVGNDEANGGRHVCFHRCHHDTVANHSGASCRRGCKSVPEPLAVTSAGSVGCNRHPTAQSGGTKKEIDELLHHVRATRWPGKETLPDCSQGAQAGATNACRRTDQAFDQAIAILDGRAHARAS